MGIYTKALVVCAAIATFIGGAHVLASYTETQFLNQLIRSGAMLTPKPTSPSEEDVPASPASVK